MPTPPTLQRDPRVDLVRGAALLMIFVDHIPDNRLSDFTMHSFGFADAAELFVVFAGFSSMAAYGRVFHNDGGRAGLLKVLARCLKLYEVQVGLLLLTLCVVKVWTTVQGAPSLFVGPLLRDGLGGALRGVSLAALPPYLDILPLYLVLLALFPLVYWGVRKSMPGTLLVSALVYGAANIWHLNLPNMVDPHDVGAWFFDPFAWQFIFVIGAVFAALTLRGGPLQRNLWLALVCRGYLLFALIVAAPWHLWSTGWAASLPVEILGNNPKAFLAPLRLLNGISFVYLSLTSLTLLRLCGVMFLKPVIACGRHSLEVFALGSIMALFGRLAFRSLGTEWQVQLVVNAIGLMSMLALARLLDARRPVMMVKPGTPAKDVDEPVQPRRSFPRETVPRPELLSR